MHKIFRDGWVRNLAGFPAFFLAFGLVLAAGRVADARVQLNSQSKHNFVQYGFAGAGVCDECHAAGGGASSASRLWRISNATIDSAMCINTCHSSTNPVWPSGTVWNGVGNKYNLARGRGTNPPPLPHRFPSVPVRCASLCHWPPAGTDYSNCLSCHAAGLNATFGITSVGYDNGRDLEIAKFMPSVGNVSNSGIISEHNIKFSGNFFNPADNECLKCHGTQAATLHPGGNDKTPLYAYPDDPDGTGPEVVNGAVRWTYDPDGGGPIVNGDPIYRWPTAIGNTPVPDYGLLEKFCLSCHDGKASAVANAAIQFNGKDVPPVPRREPNSARPDKIPNPPYFASQSNPPSDNVFVTNNFFKKNGHGRPDSLEAGVGNVNMNLTCLAQSPQGMGNSQWGCHIAHGSKNAYLIQNYDNNDVGNQMKLGNGVSTPNGLAVNVCMGCHPRTRLDGTETGSMDGSAYSAHGPYEKNFFHTWMGFGKILHAGAANGFVYWNIAHAGSMDVEDSGVGNPVMPFFASPNVALDEWRTGETRLYGNRVLGNGANGSTITCVTCHDVHGTADSYLDLNIVNGVTNGISTKGMTRLYLGNFSYDDLICQVCHAEP